MNWLTRLLLSVPILFGLTQAATAQQVCRTQQRTTYVQQPVQQVQQQPVYQQGYYQQPVQQVVQQTIQYPVVIGVPLSDLGINYYFSVSPEKRESRIVEQVTKELLAKMNAQGFGILVPLQDQTQVQPQPPTPAPMPTPQPPSPQPQPQPNNNPGVVVQPEGPSVPQQQPPANVPPPPTPATPVTGPGGLPPAARSQLQVLSVMQNKCMKCHNPGEIKKGIKLFNSDGSLFDNDIEKRIDIMNSVLRKEGATAMPPKESLTADEKKVLLGWLQEKL